MLRTCLAAGLLLCIADASQAVTSKRDVPATSPSDQSKEVTPAGAIAGLGFAICFGLAGLLFYMLPTFIAMMRHHQNTAAIAALNILLGWTFLGWVIAIVWSFTEVTTRAAGRGRYRAAPQAPDGGGGDFNF